MEIDDEHLLRGGGVEHQLRARQLGVITPGALVIHYTAANGGGLRHMMRPEAYFAHLWIGRDGRVVQLAPLNRMALHAGTSKWKGRASLNRWTPGIELENWGWLTRGVGGRWRSWTGAPVVEADAIVADHANGGMEGKGWQRFPDAQVERCAEVAVAICKRYGIEPEDVVGHDQVSPGRKWDPGPAFDMDALRTKLGRIAPPQVDRIDTVIEAQRALHALGFPPGPIDGIRGRRTNEAARGFVRAEGLAPAVARPKRALALYSALQVALRAEEQDAA